MSGSGVIASLRGWALRLKRDITALWIAARDPRTPLAAKLLAAVVAAYALSPIDLIPDFIPILGYLDDVLILPAGIWLALRLIPASLVSEFRAAASARSRPPASRVGLAAVLAAWAFVSIAGYFAFRRWT